MKSEFSKKLLIVDYIILPVLLFFSVLFPDVDFPVIICAWIAQLGISTGAYYWKAKNENRVKVPMKVIRSLPKDIREQLDLTSIITEIIRSD